MKSTFLVALALLCFASIVLAAPAAANGKPAAAAAADKADASKKPQSYYDLFGVTQFDARDEKILKRAYRKLALAHHPDKATSETDRVEKQNLFVKYANAYEILTDPRLKKRYDYLLSQGITEYDSTRDWDNFDASQGFKRRPKTQAEKDQQAKFKEAQEIFRRAQEEAEEFALWSSLSIAFGIALLPTAYMFYSRYANQKQEEAKKKERSSELKNNQAVLLELQAEQERQKKEAQEAERAYARELRAEREAAAAEAAAAKHNKAAPSADGDWEVVDDKTKGEDDDSSDKEKNSDEEEEEEEVARSSVKLKCTLCNKSYKTQQKLSEHENSNAHKKALKDAERAGKKKSRRDE